MKNQILLDKGREAFFRDYGDSLHTSVTTAAAKESVAGF